MATVTGLTAARMIAMENQTVIDGNVVGNNLILVTRDGTNINAGNVRGPIGPSGASFIVCTSTTRPAGLTTTDEGKAIYETDTNLIRVWTGARWKLQERVICTTTSRPTGLVAADEGVKIYETDTDIEYIWTGAAWLPAAAYGMSFANAAARDAAIPTGSRKIGMRVYQITEGGWFTWDGSVWRGQPNGELAVISATADSGGFGGGAGGTVAPYLNLTAFMATGRIYEVSFTSTLENPVAGQTNTSIGRSGTAFAITTVANSSWVTVPVHMIARIIGTGVSQSFDIAAQTTAVGAKFRASTANPGYFRIIDVGST